MQSEHGHRFFRPTENNSRINKSKLVGGFNHLEKYARQLGLLFPIYGKKKVPNHQPANN
jgi:hypothetical protein